VNEENILRKLASAARGDAPPATDVRAGVLRQVAAIEQPSSLLLWSLTAAAAAAAVVVSALAAHAAAAGQDPFGEFLESMMMVTL